MDKKKQDAAYKRLTTDEKTHTDWMGRDERFSMKMEKKAEIAIFMSDKLWNKGYNKKQRRAINNKRIKQEGLTFINTYAPDLGRPKYWDAKGETNNNIIIVVDFNTPLTSNHRSSRKKIIKKTLSLNDTLYQMDLIDIYTMFFPKQGTILWCRWSILRDESR